MAAEETPCQTRPLLVDPRQVKCWIRWNGTRRSFHCVVSYFAPLANWSRSAKILCRLAFGTIYVVDVRPQTVDHSIGEDIDVARTRHYVFPILWRVLLCVVPTGSGRLICRPRANGIFEAAACATKKRQTCMIVIVLCSIPSVSDSRNVAIK